MRIALLNPNTSIAFTAAMVGLARAALPSAIEVESHTAPLGSELISDPAGLAAARCAVVNMGASLPDGISGVVIAAFGDPGLIDLRQALNCPVVGIGESALLEAAATGRRFSIVTTTPMLVPAIRAAIEALELTDLFCSVQLTGGDPVSLMRDPNRLANSLVSTAHRARDDGAEVVVIGGGPLSFVARHVADRVSIAVIEPISAAARRIMKLLDDRQQAPTVEPLRMN